MYSVQAHKQLASLYPSLFTILLFVISQVGGIRNCTTETGEALSVIQLSLCIKALLTATPRSPLNVPFIFITQLSMFIVSAALMSRQAKFFQYK